MSREGLIADVKKRIEQSGFPTEFKAKGVFYDAGWMLEDDDLYVDLESGEIREGDIRASLYPVPKLRDAGLEFPYYVHMAVECKRPAAAWVFLSHRVPQAGRGGYVTSGDHYRLKTWPPVLLEGEPIDEDYAHKHPNALAQWRARKFFDMREPQSKDEQPTADDRIRKALLGSIKNLFFLGLRKISGEYNDYLKAGTKISAPTRIMEVYLPVVVVEGHLVRAVFGGPKADVVAEEVDRVYVQVEHHFSPSPALGPKDQACSKWLGRFWGGSYLVTVVRLQALSSFLEDVKRCVAALPTPPKHYPPDYSDLDELVNLHLAAAVKRSF